MGISQEELADRAGLHRTYISDVERGSRNVSLKNIERLSRALDVSVAAFFQPPQLTQQPAHASRATSPGPGLVDVLIVEDNPDDVEISLDAFKKARFANRLHVVSDGAAALDFVFCRGEYSHREPNLQPQMILLDLSLPKVRGLEVLRRLKADPRTARIPVVILTGSKSSADLVECRRLGAANCILKPLNFHNLCLATPPLKLDWVLVRPLEKLSHTLRS